MQLWLDGEHLATVELPRRKWSEHRVAVPASAWSPGASVLVLRFERDSDAGNPRDLSVAFDYLEIVP
jgi:hypothetical protein